MSLNVGDSCEYICWIDNARRTGRIVSIKTFEMPGEKIGALVALDNGAVLPPHRLTPITPIPVTPKNNAVYQRRGKK